MSSRRPSRSRLHIVGAVGLCFAVFGSGCSSNAKTGLRGSGGTASSGGATAQGGTALSGGSTARGGATAVGGTAVSGGTSASGLGGATGSGGSQNTCPSPCVLVCQEDPPCNCYCPNAGGAGGSSTATGGNGGTTGTGGATSSGGGIVGVDAGADAGQCPAGQMWCPGCTPGTGGCGVTCTGYACPPPDAGTGDAASAGCAQVTTQAECDRRSDCHSVFLPGTTCGCSTSGCCQLFNRCANGGRANCSGSALCNIAAFSCAGPYVLSYAGNCYEGCVLQTECASADAGVIPPACPSTPPPNTSSCGSTNMTCFYDNCPSTGRAQATCAGGTWTVQTTACGTVSCTGAPSTLTCPSGKMCLVTESGAVQAQCVDNACGQGPITSQCGTSLAGCSVNATLSSGVTIVCYTCPAGQTCAH